MDGSIVTSPKMNSREAKIFWRYIQKSGQVGKFNALMNKLENKELMIKHVNVDQNERIRDIILENKDKPSIPYQPFLKHFKIS